ncbi:hypothetical protein QCA50_015099 [Cerrena zonata]|uniref:Protein kinase domain-containing protein n=1 Tax=Cerrena zonata TaxID=2478898 RepID=A0AAW0FR47_9APHY
MEQSASNIYLDSLRQALEERRESWKKMNLHMWFDVSAECGKVERILGSQSWIQDAGRSGDSIQTSPEEFVKTLVMTIQNDTATVKGIQFPLQQLNDTAQTLAKILCESIVGTYATIDDPQHGFIHLLQLAIKSKLHKSILVAFSGQAAEIVLALMTQRNLDGTYQEPLRSLWQKHRSIMLRLLRRLAENSETIPATLYLTGVVCTQRDNPIATGGNADIFAAEVSGFPVVLKRLRVSEHDRARNVKKFCREALLWSHLSHAFVQVFLGVDKDTFDGHYCMVTQWMENGNINKCMASLVESGRSVPYDRWLLELCEGIEYLHQERVIHGDIRGDNILIDNGLHIRITDFGLSSYATSNPTSVASGGGSTRWMAPELLISGNPSFQSDVYAFAITCIEIYTRQKPYPELTNEAQVIQRVMKNDRPTRPNNDTGREMSFSLWLIVDSCWAQDPFNRPPISDAVTSIRSVIRTSTPAVGITSAFEELIYDSESSLYRSTPRRSYIPYVPIAVVILIYLGLSLYAVIAKDSFDKIVLFFPLFMSFLIQLAYARTISSWIRYLTHWEVDERAFKDYCKHSILSGFCFLFLLFPVMALTEH